ncbi:MAG: hypothetical protein H6713_41175 [Myxococcales bacterium]|nr:hypothetical protein [Myxococcales bacterium]
MRSSLALALALALVGPACSSPTPRPDAAPTPEAPADDAADDAPPAATPPENPGLYEAWEQTFRSEDHARVTAIAATPAGELVLGGYLRGNLRLYEHELAPQGGDDVLLVRTNAEGVPRWARSLGDSSLQQLNALALTPDGDALIAGVFTHRIPLAEARVSKGHVDIFLARLAPNGDVRWDRTFGDVSADAVEALALDRAGDLWVTGWFRHTLDLGDGAPLTARGEQDAFVARYSPAGELRWSLQLGVTGVQLGRALALTPDGDVLVAGLTSGALELGEHQLDSGSLEDIFLARLSPEGAPRWLRAVGHPGYREQLHGVACSPAGAVVLSARRGPELELDELTLPRTRDSSPLLASFDGDGKARWAAAPDDRFHALADRGLGVLSGGDIVVLGGTAPARHSFRDAEGVGEEMLLQRVSEDGARRSDPLLLTTNAWGRGTALTVLPGDHVIVAGTEIHPLSDPNRPRLRSVEHVVLRGYELTESAGATPPAAPPPQP